MLFDFSIEILVSIFPEQIHYLFILQSFLSLLAYLKVILVKNI